jgi:hypothetical protein
MPTNTTFNNNKNNNTNNNYNNNNNNNNYNNYNNYNYNSTNGRASAIRASVSITTPAHASLLPFLLG